MTGTPLTLAPVARETLQSKVYTELKAAISSGGFVPGEPVTLRRLADTFGTSIMPVRDAVNRLKAEGALEILPNRTVIIPEMTMRKFEDLTQLRVMVEGHAAYRASLCIDAQAVDALAALNDRLLDHIRDRDVHRALAANRDFHFAIYAAAGADVHMRVIEMLWIQAGPFLYVSMNSPSARWSTTRHLEILSSLRAGDALGVQQGVVADIKDTAQHLEEIGAFAESTRPALRALAL